MLPFYGREWDLLSEVITFLLVDATLNPLSISEGATS